jgi:hypothetical protein
MLVLLLTVAAWAGPGFLGVGADPLTAEQVQRQRLPITEGAVVHSVIPGSPAAQIGLLPGDVIYMLNDTSVNVQNLTAVTSGAPPGTTVDVKFFRNGQQLVFRTQLADRDRFVNAITVPQPPGANVKSAFLREVQSLIQRTEAGDGISTLYFEVADEAGLIRVADQYLLGVAVDPDYVRTVRLLPYLEQLLGKKVETKRGFTQPKDLGAWDAAVTPQEARYNGWVVMAQSPQHDPKTAFHECIHVQHLVLQSDDDDDTYAAPEDICNTFCEVVSLLRTKLDPRIQLAAERARAGQDVSQEKATLLKSLQGQRERMSLATANFPKCLRNIGGKADWEGYRMHIERILKARKPRPTQTPPVVSSLSPIGFWRGNWSDSNGARGAGTITILWNNSVEGTVNISCDRFQAPGRASGSTATWKVDRRGVQTEGRFTVEAGNRSATCTIITRAAEGSVTTCNWRLTR